ncbi:MFS transporter [Legionella israelensis]|uniref:Lysosomal dipeptide transporter MFSD1 n=1 Tax=Legionella israelensis TaxID=454 RepID=A0AAX1EIK7_9GAMM|nr:MFS transporter [Legionella israelensis]QBR84859.1 MFS transporter [Legionella israelensis]
MSLKNNLLLQKLYPWLIWTLAAGFFFYKYFIQVSPSVISSQLMNTFALSGAGLGHLAACFFYAYLIMQIPAGLILDRYSPRMILFLASFLCAVGILIFAHSQQLYWAELSRFLNGLTAAFAAVACFKLITLWFPPERFALMAGLSMAMAMLGAISGEAPLSYLVSRYDWRKSLEIIAVFGFLLSFLILFILSDKKTDGAQRKKPEKLFPNIKGICKNRQTWLLSLYSGLAFSPVSVFGGLWGVSFIEKAYGLVSINAASAVSLIFVGFAIGSPFSGWLSDYMQRRKPLMWFGTLTAFLSLSLILYAPISSFILYFLLFLFGLGTSCFFLCFSMIKEIHSLVFAGTVLGFMNTFDSLCEALTEPFVGKLLDISWNGQQLNGVRLFSVVDYRFGLSVLSIYLALSIFLLFFIKETGTHCK